MPQQEDSIGFTSSSGDQAQCRFDCTKRAERFLMAMAVQMRRALRLGKSEREAPRLSLARQELLEE